MCTDALFSWGACLRFFNKHLFLSQLQSFNPDKLTGVNGRIYRYETVYLLMCPKDIATTTCCFQYYHVFMTSLAEMPIISPTSSRLTTMKKWYLTYWDFFPLSFSISAHHYSFQIQGVRYLTVWWFCHSESRRLKTWF